MTLIATYTPAGASTVDIVIPGGYTNYMILAPNFRASANNGAVGIRCTSDNFATVSNWAYQTAVGWVSTGTAPANTSSGSQPYIFGSVTGNSVAAAADSVSFSLTLFNPSGTTYTKQIQGQLSGVINTFGGYNGFGMMNGFLGTSTAAALNGIRIFCGNSATITATIKFYGLS
jgi:hypothetical protein